MVEEWYLVGVFTGRVGLVLNKMKTHPSGLGGFLTFLKPTTHRVSDRVQVLSGSGGFGLVLMG